MESFRDISTLEHILQSLPTFENSSDEKRARMIVTPERDIALVKYYAYSFKTTESEEDNIRSIYGVFFEECFQEYDSSEWEHSFTECGLEACFAIYSRGKALCITQSIDEALEIFAALKQTDITNNSIIEIDD